MRLPSRVLIAPCLPGVLILVWAALCLARILTWPDAVRLDYDEGVNLMKARLVLDGHGLYREIWSDQPPLFTWLLAGWTALVGETPAAGRALVAAFSVLLLASAARLGRLLGCPGAALAAVLLLMGAKQVFQLSVSVMIGLPALALALFACVLALEGARRRRPAPWLLASGTLFTCAGAIKLFAVFLLPLLVLACWERARQSTRPWSRLLRHGAWWTLGAALTLPVFLPVMLPVFEAQMLAPHLRQVTDGAARLDTLRAILARFAEDAPLMLAALAAWIAADRHTRRRCRPLLAWLLTSVLLLAQTTPLWTHHRIMFSIPAALVAAIAGASLWQTPAGRRAWIAHGLLVAAIAVGLVRLGINAATFGSKPRQRVPAEVWELLRASRDCTGWVASDEPFAIYAAGRAVPPEMAVLTVKRLRSGFDRDQFSELVSRYRPALVVMERHLPLAADLETLDPPYTLVARKDSPRLAIYRRAADCGR